MAFKFENTRLHWWQNCSDTYLSPKLRTVTELRLISISSDGSSGIPQLESKSSSSVKIEQEYEKNKNNSKIPSWHEYSSFVLLVTFTQLHQAGEIWLSSLLSERFCKAEIRETPHTARWMAKFYHLSSPGNPAAWNLDKEHMLWLKRTYRELQLMVQHSYLLDWDQIWACHKEIGQISLQALFFSLQLILLLEQLGENLLLCHSGLRDWRNLHEMCMGQCVQISAAGGRRGKVETLASWSRRLSSAISLRYLLSRAPSSDTSVTWGSFFIFFAVLANYCKEVTAGGLKCLAVYVLSGSHVKASANFYFTQT